MLTKSDNNHEGDDLIAAQFFVMTAKAQMDVLTGIERLDPERAERAVFIVREAAKPVLARAVMRVCDQALELLKSDAGQPQIDTVLRTIQKLVLKYSSGLDQLVGTEDDDVETAGLAQEVPEQVAIALEAHNDKAPQTFAPKPSKSVRAYQSRDKVLNHALTAELNTRTISKLQLSQTDLDGLVLANRSAAKVLEPLTASLSDTAFKPALERLLIPFPKSNMQLAEIGSPVETIMPSLTHLILTDARQLGKCVSVTYSNGELCLPEQHLPLFEACLKTLSRALIRHCLEAPDVRTSRGESASGLVSILAEQFGNQKLGNQRHGSQKKIEPKLEAYGPSDLKDGINVNAGADINTETQADTCEAIYGSIDTNSGNGVRLEISCEGKILPQSIFETLKTHIEQQNYPYTLSFKQKDTLSILCLYASNSILGQAPLAFERMFDARLNLPLSRETRFVQESVQ